jgi:hypothetical protein
MQKDGKGWEANERSQNEVLTNTSFLSFGLSSETLEICKDIIKRHLTSN